MPWEGYNFEDAIILSERLVRDDVLTSIHIDEHEIDARDTKLGPEEITRDIPNLSEEILKDLDERGIIRVGAEVGPGDVLVGKVTPKGETELTPEERLLRAIFGEKAREVRDTSLKVPHGEEGKVIDVKVFTREDGHELPPGVNQLVRVYVGQKRKISVGDKLAGRHGNKGVISKILPVEDMPFLADGTPVDIVLNPLGVPSRMNVGQVLEAHLGYAARWGWEVDGEKVGEPPTAAPRPRPARRPRPPPSWPRPCSTAPTGTRRSRPASTRRSRRSSRTSRPSRTTPSTATNGRLIQNDGKTTLYDGRTGEPYDNPVTVGYVYILKLAHLVDDKIHARSTGPYSMITQQPLGGKAQFGGQRFGEMEVWALEAYGAAYCLQEMLTIKSDDVLGRVKVYEAIVKGENIPEPGIPESFKVLIKEMQALCLNVGVMNETGEEVEIRELDEDTFRTTEALGIDLSRPERGTDEEDERRRAASRGSSAREAATMLDVNELQPAPDRPGHRGLDPHVVERRGEEAGDHQLPHAQAGEGRALLREDLRSDQGLGVLLRQVQARPVQGHHLRALRRRGHPLEGPPRAHGPHRARRARHAHLVLQAAPEPARPTSSTSRPRGAEGQALEKVIYFAAHLVTWVDEERRDADRPNLEKEMLARARGHREGARPAHQRVASPSSRTRSRPSRRRAPRTPTSRRARRRPRRRSARSARPTRPRSTCSAGLGRVRDLFARKILDDEMLWRELKDRYGEYFKGDMGADAVKSLINRLDLDVEEEKLKAAIDRGGAAPAVRPAQAEGHQAPQDRHRLQQAQRPRQQDQRPGAMMLDVVPVIPPDLRPMVQLDGGRFATSDLNDLYRRVINRNNRLKRCSTSARPRSSSTTRSACSRRPSTRCSTTAAVAARSRARATAR